VAAILCRELLITGLRVGLAGRFSLPVSRLGKWKTASQMVAIALMLFAPTLLSFSDPEWSAGEGEGLAYLFTFLLLAGEILLWLAAILSWLSAGLYIRAGWRQLAARAQASE
jgi:cardiolipin synthase